MNYELIIKNGFAWINDKKVLTYIGIWFVLGIISLAGISFILQDFFSGLFNLNSLVNSNLSDFLIQFIQFFIVILGFALIMGLIQGFLSVLILLKGMNFYKIKTTPFNAIKYVKLIVLQFLSGILAFISYYDKRFFFVFLGIIALYLIGIITLVSGIGIILIALAVFLSLIYVFIVIYNSTKLAMSPYIFLETNKGIFQSLRDSWNLTQGKVIDIFIALLIIGTIVMIVSLIVSQIGQRIVSLIFPEAIAQGQNSLVIIQNIGLITFISGFFSVIAGVIMDAFALYSYSGIYSQIKKSK